MADVTLSSCKFASQLTDRLTVQFGEAVSEGRLVYQKTSSGLYHLANCETSLATSIVAGMTVNTYAEDDWGEIAIGGLVNVATVVADTAYFLSTAGLIMPYADINTNDWLSLAGMSDTTGTLDLSIFNYQRQAA